MKKYIKTKNSKSKKHSYSSSLSSKNKKGGNVGKSKKIKGPLKTVNITSLDSEDIKKYVVPHSSDKVEPKVWELPNRKRFFNWVQTTFKKYDLNEEFKLTKGIKEERDRRAELDRINLNNVQQVARDFMQGESPYRGLLLYLGLGVGKTCAAIAIAEAIMNRKEVLILSKASLEDNFINDIERCGAEYMTKKNYWVFSKCKRDSEKQLVSKLNIPESVISENDGVFLIDFTKNNSNYKSFSEIDKNKLNHQIRQTIRNRYKFLHLDDTRLTKKINSEYFNNKVVVIDEVHNLINTMATGRPRGEWFYESFMNAKNAKFVFLSGTPLINTVYESTKLFNILRGYIPNITVKIKTIYDTNIEYGKIKSQLQKLPHVDQITINKVNKTIKVSKNPDNFINSVDGKGIIYKPTEHIENDVFQERINEVFNKMGLKTSISLKNETCLPNNIIDFQILFHNPELNKLKKTDLFKKRIAGLLSYYQYQDKSLFPDVTAINIERVPLNNYQLGIYEKYRNEEIQRDKNVSKKKGKEENFQPSYRIKSRLACTFVFPEDTGSPYEDKNIEVLESLGSKLEDVGEEIDIDEIKTEKEIAKTIKSSYLKLLDKKKAEYLDINNGSLAKHSPKYLKMLQNIEKTKGTCLVYSYFRTLIGLNTFGFALEQTGKYAPLRIKKVDGYWELDEKDDEKGKPKFCFYTGNEDRVTREIYRKIFNSLWDELDPSCSKLVKQLKKKDVDGKENLYGKIVKILMTTKTGAEGLNLKNVRQVHIMEPYWQPVLIEQVIGRAVRTESHIRLPPRDRNVEVFIYMSTFTPELSNSITFPAVRRDFIKFNDEALGMQGKLATSDEYLYAVSERKKKIVNEMQHLMKEAAFDCLLNYRDNSKQTENIICLDYETQNRDDYLSAPEITDTIDIIDLKQEKIVATAFKKVIIKGKIYYYNTKPDANGKMYIYDEKLKLSTKLPKPVGRVMMVNGNAKFALKKQK